MPPVEGDIWARGAIGGSDGHAPGRQGLLVHRLGGFLVLFVGGSRARGSLPASGVHGRGCGGAGGVCRSAASSDRRFYLRRPASDWAERLLLLPRPRRRRPARAPPEPARAGPVQLAGLCSGSSTELSGHGLAAPGGLLRLGPGSWRQVGSVSSDGDGSLRVSGASGAPGARRWGSGGRGCFRLPSPAAGPCLLWRPRPLGAATMVSKFYVLSRARGWTRWIAVLNHHQ